MTNKRIIEVLAIIASEYEVKAERTATNSLYKKYSEYEQALNLAIIEIGVIEQEQVKKDTFV